MEQREVHLQPFGICYRLYRFIMKTLTSQAFKKVTLGRPMNYESRKVPVFKADKEFPPIQCLCGDSVSSSTEQAQEKNNASIDSDKMAEGPSSLPDQSKAPRKMVSFNENVEEIFPIKKKKKKSGSFKKSNSLDREEEEEPKPLRSILKVGSIQRDQSDSY
ncbi:hypothetical protein L6164_035080 [Bauhinia variegata]|uniref:Uncharacterized protein n=1 Tax=Bauhinia variegata TaxID=167791 RepID=A0ACB9KWI4_BAUVA|nr:hypothetical protein L6164_035080 [Bauhinia variegata]